MSNNRQNREKLINGLGATEELTRNTQRLHELISNLMRDPNAFPTDSIKTQLDNINRTLNNLQNSLDEVDMDNLVDTEDILLPDPSSTYDEFTEELEGTPNIPVQETTQVKEEIPEGAREVTSQVVQRGRGGTTPNEPTSSNTNTAKTTEDRGGKEKRKELNKKQKAALDSAKKLQEKKKREASRRKIKSEMDSKKTTKKPFNFENQGDTPK